MTMAISKAAEEGAKAVICASTGNTTASAAAYAVRAGMVCAVLVPEGKIALGKMSQALAHGATLLQVEGNFDDCLTLARDLSEQLPGRAGQLRQPVPHRGPEDGRVRDRRRARRRPRHPRACRSATPATSPRTGRATASTPPTASRPRRPRMWGFQAAGAAPIVDGAPVAQPADHRHRDPHRQPGVVEAGRGGARRVRRPDRHGHRPRRSSRPTGCSPRRRACSSSRRRPPRSPVCCRRTQPACSTRARPSSAPSPATASRTREWAIAGAPAPVTVPVDAHGRGRRARPRRLMRRRRWPAPTFRAAPVHVRVPATSANLGPGFDALRPRARRCTTTSSSQVTDEPASTSRSRARARTTCRRDETPPRRPGDARRRSTRSAAQPRGLALRLRQPDPARARPRLVAPPRSSPGSSPPGRSSSAAASGSTTPRCSRWPPTLEGHPDNVAACLLGGFTVAWTEADGVRARAASPCAPTSSRSRFVPADAGRRRRRRARLLPDRGAARRRGRSTPAARPCWSPR